MKRETRTDKGNTSKLFQVLSRVKSALSQTKKYVSSSTESPLLPVKRPKTERDCNIPQAAAHRTNLDCKDGFLTLYKRLRVDGNKFLFANLLKPYVIADHRYTGPDSNVKSIAVSKTVGSWQAAPVPSSKIPLKNSTGNRNRLGNSNFRKAPISSIDKACSKKSVGSCFTNAPRRGTPKLKAEDSRASNYYNENAHDTCNSFKRKSLAWDTAFFTSPGLLAMEELRILNGGFKKPNKNVSPSRINKVVLSTVESHSNVNIHESFVWDNAFFSSPGLLDFEELRIVNGGFKKFEFSLSEVPRTAKPNSRTDSYGFSFADHELDAFNKRNFIKTQDPLAIPATTNMKMKRTNRTSKRHASKPLSMPLKVNKPIAMRRPVDSRNTSKDPPKHSIANRNQSHNSNISKSPFGSVDKECSKMLSSPSQNLTPQGSDYSRASKCHGRNRNINFKLIDHHKKIAAANCLRNCTPTGLRKPSPRLGFFD